MKNLIYILFSIFPLLSNAHQSDLSTTMITELDNQKWIVQVKSALTAFQYEIKKRFPEKSYTTPEEFQEMVSELIKENTLICFNNTDTAMIENIHVKIGHETNVVVEISNVPTSIQTILVKNSSFQHIHRSQNALMILKEGFKKTQFALNRSNQYAEKLFVLNNSFIKDENHKSAYTPIEFKMDKGFLLLLIAMTIGICLIVVFKFKKSPFSN